MSPTIVWFRSDLRVHDHEALKLAAEASRGHVIPVYCLDPEQFKEDALGFRRIGARRARFLLESVASLQRALRALGSELIIVWGEPTAQLLRIANAHQAGAIYLHQEATTEEHDAERALELRAREQRIALRRCWGHTLYHVEDLPHAIDALAPTFTAFRRALEDARVVPRPLLPAPTNLRALPAQPTFSVQDALNTLGYLPQALDHDPRQPLRFIGGIEAAHERMAHYIWQADALRHYKQSRDNLLGLNFASKLSLWLATGSLSPREVYAQVRAYERQRVANDSTYWLIFELLWRDYFRFLALQRGALLFMRRGIKQRDALAWRQDRDSFKRWCDGETGIPFVDANMVELRCTGFMSNRGRQNVASFLAKTLQIDWRWGARYFESALIDYDPCSNWGNWQYVSGVGNDPRDRVFNVVGQGKRYDELGDYIKTWLPALKALPAEHIHEPHQLPASYLDQRFGVRLGRDYPSAPLTAPLQPKGHGAQLDLLGGMG